ncbi:glycosyltransferase [Sphingobacterium sp. SRCM116780]|uniref:glycosyltransferase n=1 Tax=Sphingobacterium sp. SRCM116780 TaxID=2907623 RepID=UPI001F2C16BB|nr:glycosyltransferase [Sphingobacterium sp. SRCM116780]UIR56287.1 glycosyltransferase [Sphingobacterium sp. SRCM116780]
MRILIIHTFYQNPGGEDTVFQQESELLAIDNDVLTLTFQNKKGWKGALQTLFSFWNLAAAYRVRDTIKEFKPEVIHIHNTHYASGPIILRSIHNMGIPLVMTLHNFRLICPSAILYHDHELFLASIQEKFPWTAVKKKVMDHSTIKTFILALNYWFHRKIGTWNSVNRYITLSSFAKKLFTSSTLTIDPNKFVIKPNFTFPIDMSSLSFEDYFIYIGRLTEEKGILNLLEAFAKVDYKILIIGDGELKQSVQHAAQQHTNIHYLGFKSREDIIPLVEKAEALIVPSLWFEGMPMTILEAFSVGTPVIGSDIGALSELILPNRTGLLFNPQHVESMLTTLTCWKNYSQQEKFNIRQTTKEFYFSNFTPTENKKQLLQIYQEAIHDKKKIS